MTQQNSPSGSTISEAEAFLANHPEIEAIDIILYDSNAIARGKIIRRHELMGLYKNGRHLPISILGLDICGEDVDETGLVWEQGDGDLRAWPVPASLRVIAGSTPPRAELFMALYTLEGDPMPCDPRHALARQIKVLADQGLTPSGAFELEFFLLEEDPDHKGKYRPASSVVDGRFSNKTEVYSVDHLHDMLPLFADIYKGAEMADIRAETMISEYAPGQYELTLHYRANVMAAADDLMRLKRIVRKVARSYGKIACFMAKPFEDRAGSGMHFHVSLQNEAGVNVFTETETGIWAAPLLHALGGLRETMAQSMLIFAPHANSWRRFSSQSYAPVSINWGVNNRSVALRIPAGDPRARRIEHRPSGVDANPYLVATTVLAGISHGLNGRSDPGPETTGNGYKSAAHETDMPKDWRSAIEAAQTSAFLQNALGPDLHRAFCAIKAAEYGRVARTVSELDYQLYLHTV